MYEFPTERALPLCTDVSGLWNGPLSDFHHSIGSFYDQSIEIIGDKLKWFRTETMSRSRPITRHALGLLPHWLNDSRARRQITTLDLESSDDPDWPSDTALTIKIFDTVDLKAGACRLALPAAMGLETPERLRELAHQLLASSNFTYGLAGFSVNWDPLSPAAAQAEALFSHIAARFAGVDIPDLTGTVLALPDGIKCVNWITFLGNAIWEASGVDAGELRKRDDIDVESGPDGVLITAGRRPALGDRYKREELAAYRFVGSKLSPIRAHSHQAILPAGRDDDEDARTESWLGRFDTEPA